MLKFITRTIFSPVALMVGIPLLLSMTNPATASDPMAALQGSIHSVASPVSSADIGSITRHVTSRFTQLASMHAGHGNVFVSGGPVYLPY